ncbi:MAG: hypothetical protein ACREMW_13105 [Gemmatimonadales bacterium]
MPTMLEPLSVAARNTWRTAEDQGLALEQLVDLEVGLWSPVERLQGNQSPACIVPRKECLREGPSAERAHDLVTSSDALARRQAGGGR